MLHAPAYKHVSPNTCIPLRVGHWSKDFSLGCSSHLGQRCTTCSAMSHDGLSLCHPCPMSWTGMQVVSAQHFSKAADVYSFGIILWELLTWQVPWDDHNPFQVTASLHLTRKDKERRHMEKPDLYPGIVLKQVYDKSSASGCILRASKWRTFSAMY